MSAMSATEYTAHDAIGLAELVHNSHVSPTELIETAISQAERLDPHINAVVIKMYDEARKTAATVVADGPFRGVPFLLKDLGAYYAGSPTTAGCRFFADYVSDHDSEIVRRYKQAGLVVFGKSASPEFGLTTSTESTLYGQTRNPWSLEHTSGGSSGGSSAAVAAGILPAAHASDGGGSIRIPASCCGLFGLKPTRARTPMGPDAGEGWSGLSTVHAVTWSVRDSAALLDCSAGPDAGDPYWAPPPSRPFLDEVGAPPGRLRIGFTSNPFNGTEIDPECRQAVENAARLCAELGHDVEEAEISIDASTLGNATRTIVGANVRANLIERGRTLGREFGDGDAELQTLAMARNAEKVSATDYALAVRTVHRVGRQVAAFFGDFDLLLSPTMATPPKKLGLLALDNENTEEFVGHLMQTVGFTQLMNVAGNPAASVPLATSESGLPIGIQFAAAFGEEAILLRLSAQLEEARPWRNRRPSLA